MTLHLHPVIEGEGAHTVPDLGLPDAPPASDLLAADDGHLEGGHRGTLHEGSLHREDLHQGEVDVLGPPHLHQALMMNEIPEAFVTPTSPSLAAFEKLQSLADWKNHLRWTHTTELQTQTSTSRT